MQNRLPVSAFTVPAALLVVRALMGDELLGQVAYVLAPAWSLSQLVRSRLLTGSSSAAWALLTAGFASLFAAELYWFGEDFLDAEIFPGPGEYLSALALSTITFGLWRTVRRVAPVGDRTGIIDSTVVSLAAAALGWLFIVEPGSAPNGLGGDEQAWLVVLLALDVSLLAMITRLGFSLRARPPAFLFLYLGAAGLVLLDGIESVLEVSVGVEWGEAGDLLEMASYSCWGLAAVFSDEMARTSPNALRYIGARRVVVLGASALVPLCAFALRQLFGAPISATSAAILAGIGATIGVLVMIRMSGLIAAVRELADERGRERFAALVEHSTDVVLTIDRAQLITYASPALKAVWGHSPSAVVGRPVATLFPQREAEGVMLALERAASLGRTLLDFESMALRPDGAERDCEAVVANLRDHPAVGELVLTLRDTTDRKALERQLRHQAFHDALTGLANRALFLDRVDHALRIRADRADHEVAVVFVDLDDFKQVNDGLGHAAGDHVLESVGARLLRCVRSSDTVARLGGDEFAILLQHRVGLSEVLAATEGILEAFRLPIGAGSLELAVRASAGVAVARPGDSAQDLVRHSDIAMYEAKGTGRGGYHVFDPVMKTAAAERIALRSDLARAIEEKQLALVYQPIVELRSGRIKGAEALLRWQHPTRGAVPPAEFVPIAEQSGMISEIGRWVLWQACREASDWQSSGARITVNVNVSALQLRDADLVERVTETLRATRLAPELLTLEITETAMMEAPDATAEILAHMRSLGVRVAIDDFGTGYCSLAYLKRFAVDFLKIDRAFVSEVKADSDHLLAHNILRMADSLGMVAVAEGLEEEAQATNLRSHGCEFGQGYFFGRPMSPEAFARRLRGES